jgi:hypothetical protein
MMERFHLMPTGSKVSLDLIVNGTPLGRVRIEGAMPFAVKKNIIAEVKRRFDRMRPRKKDATLEISGWGRTAKVYGWDGPARLFIDGDAAAKEAFLNDLKKRWDTPWEGV